ncbi:hypothetical protein NIE88_14460 [Sporolactobacillus shoreicorticis]|uniref:Uncharacterized protein n=1 Tax=Sporolactobacillus shoreicorticis TaxID=1923877 RepID=A0ABW5S7F4_9BACL|nr:hypothetical protein [Sporolactobacillus shoreicorticis]MCO7126971.1 hypothetical protein [Sporolactobacillus shoreicorticis]
MNKEQEFNRQFKARENTGEHRNGRLAQQKNHIDGNRVPNEFTSDHQNKDR